MIGSLIVIVCLYVYGRRKKVESVPLLKLFGVAALTGIPCLIAAIVLGRAVKWLCAEPFLQRYGEEDLRFLFADNFLVAGLVEEAVKMAAFLLVLLILRDQRKPVQVVQLVMSVGIGFDMSEDLLALFGGYDLFRVFVPGHLIFGGIMGLLFVRAMQAREAGNRTRATLLYVLSYVVPFLVHGLYDFLLNTPWSAVAIFLFFPLSMIAMTVFIWYYVALVKEEAAKLPASVTA